MDSLNEDSIDNIITNLKIIGLIQVNEKLCIRKGHLQIDISSNYQGIKRWIYRDSRDIVLIYLKDLIRNINSLFIKVTKYSGFLWILTRILAEMETANFGLLNLKTTYNDDPMMIVKFDTIINKFNEMIIHGKKIINETVNDDC